jgi:4-hydroxy-tetrahydrodipicolinate synthase
MNRNLFGTGVALVTPFRADLTPDYPGLGQLMAYTARGGVNYYVVVGTTGESPTVTSREKGEILAYVKEHNDARLPVVYGIGGNNTQEVLEAIKQTDFEGVEAILSVSPYYSKPSQRGIYGHYVAIADACPVPVLLYNVPARTQSNITAETTLRLAEHPNIIGTKESSGDLVQCMHIARHKPESFLLISGDDLLTVPLVSLGGCGVISVLANAFPEPFSAMVNEALAGRYQAANLYLHQLLDVNPLMYAEGNPVGIKQALQELGICGNHVRLPLAAASEDLVREIARQVRQLAGRPVASRLG